MANNRKGLAIVFMTVVIDLLGFGIVLPLLARYAQRLDAGGWTIGMLSASFSVMQFLFAPLWGRLSDRWGRRPILLLGLCGSVFSYALFAYGSYVSSLALLFVGRIGAGISGATISTAQAYIADSTPVEKRTAGMAMIGAAFGIGFTFGPLLCIVALKLDPNLSHQAAKELVSRRASAEGNVPHVKSTEPLSPLPGILASSVSAIALFLAFFMLPESLKTDAARPAHSGSHFSGIGRVLAMPNVNWLIAIGFLSIFGFGQFESTLNRLTFNAFGMSDEQNNWLFTLLGFSLVLSQGLVVRRLSGKVDDRTILIVGTATLMAGMIILCIAISLKSATMLWWLLPITVLGFALMNTSTQALISKRTSPENQGVVLGVNQSGSAMGRILAQLIGNAILDRHVMMPYLSAIVLLSIALCGGVMLRMDRLGEGPIVE